jgi:hypothetical protein
MQKVKKYTPLATDGEYALLVEATKIFRAKIRKATGLNFSHYHRVYTEPRAYGLRSKYYWCMHDFPRLEVRKYIADNPVFTVKDCTYEVVAKPLDTGMAIYVKKLNTTTKTAQYV